MKKDYWKQRAKRYDKLDWVKKDQTLLNIIRAGNFNKKDFVLDVGTGSGVLANAISPLVNKVIGMDSSQDMGKLGSWEKNKFFVDCDARDIIFKDNVFSKVMARMVFHHIIKGTQKAMNECYRVLKSGGKMILIESVPPSTKIKKRFTEIFKLKENRITFLEEDLIKLMTKAGFKNILVGRFILHNFSIRNWLENSDLNIQTQEKIFNIHIHSSKEFKEAYNLKEVGRECFIDVKDLIVVGEKWEK